MIRRFFLTLLFFLLLLTPSDAQNILSDDLSGLSLEECLILALNNHPSLRKSKASIRDYSAQLETVRAANRVKVNLTGSARYNGGYEFWNDNYDNESLSLTASKLLYDTGRNRIQKEIRRENIKGSRQTHLSTHITVAANAKRKYYDLVLKFLNRDVELEKYKNLEQHLKTAEGLYDVGNKAYIEVTKAQSDLSAAKVSLLKAENDILISEEALRVAMGTDINGPFNIALSTELLLPRPADNVSAMIDTALEDRTDFRKLMHDIKAGELSVKDAARTSSPTVTGQLSTSTSNVKDTRVNNNYYIGVNMNVPVVDGGEMKAAVESARARLEQYNADAESLRQNITYSVRSAALSLMNAVDRVKSSELSVKYAEENLTLAQGRYEVGVGDPIEVSDAVSALAAARYTYYQALYDAQTSRADLDEALGHLPPEIEGKEELWEAQ
ncbi:MAG: TolC family protein [Synergistaceae bacterium]|nr:TolC family protein [Synergistaceae bacterium]